MPSISKTSRCKYLVKILAIIISIYKESKLHMQIGNHLKLAKSTVISIIYRYNKQPKHPLQPIKQAGRLVKLDDQAKRLFICHIK